MKPTRLSEARRLRKAMRKAGALSPDTALLASVCKDLLASDIDPYVDAGMLKEAAPGTFYLDESTASALIRKQTVVAAVFWFLVIIMPVVILQLTNMRSTSP